MGLPCWGINKSQLSEFKSDNCYFFENYDAIDIASRRVNFKFDRSLLDTGCTRGSRAGHGQLVVAGDT